MRYQDFKSIELLFENRRQYRDMMMPLVRIGLFEENELPTLIDPVRKRLKRNDRIVWYLRYLRIQILYYNRDKIEDFDRVFKKITGENPERNEPRYLQEFRNYFLLTSPTAQHIISLFDQIPEVERIEWSGTPSELYSEIIQAENDWRERQQQLVNVQPDDRIIIDYGKQAWVLLDREFCRDEGAAMGHCGNAAAAGAGDRILSFRTKTSDLQQKPHLTFILDRDGFLGEMKGRANQKPNSKYHPYIVDLLKQDFVVGIKGGGYEPENNFSINDLDEETRKRLVELKPTLGGIKELFNREGMTDRVERVIDKRSKEVGLTWYFWDRDENQFTIYESDSIEEIAENFSLDVLEYAAGVYSGDQLIDVSSDWVRELMRDSDRINELFEASPVETQEKIVEYYTGEGYDNLVEAVRELDDLDDAFRSAFYSGIESGTRAEIINDVNDWLKDNNFKFYEPNEIRKYTDLSKFRSTVQRNGSYFMLIDPDEFFKHLDEGYESWEPEEDLKDLQQPSYGWDGWDETVAVERLVDEISENIR